MIFFPSTKTLSNNEIPEEYLPWWKGKGSLARLTGGDELRITLSVDINMEEAVRSAIERSKIKNPFRLDFSLLSLPIQTQAVYRVLLLLLLAGSILLGRYTGYRLLELRRFKELA